MMNLKSSNKITNLERLLIFHLGLAPSVPDESAPIEELCEYILYYHDSEAMQIDFKLRYDFEEAVKFANLASSFFLIQSTIDDHMLIEHNKSSFTSEVTLSTCTIVFIPLENVDGLVAVAQLSRHINQGNESDALIFTPNHIREKVLKAHDTFKSLYSGGIHTQLCESGDNMEINGDASYSYRKFQSDEGVQNASIHQLASYGSGIHGTIDSVRAKEESELNLSKCCVDMIRINLRNFYDAFIQDLGV